MDEGIVWGALKDFWGEVGRTFWGDVEFTILGDGLVGCGEIVRESDNEPLGDDPGWGWVGGGFDDTTDSGLP